MKNENTSPEIVEIGKAQEMILGPKDGGDIDSDRAFLGSLDLDE
jgi:hypothetical protein